jgi:hypothetical protein
MKLEDLPWQPGRTAPTTKVHMQLPDGTWLFILGGDDDIYDIYHDRIASAQVQEDVLAAWLNADTLMAQCIVYSLFQVTQPSNGEDNGDTEKNT